MFQKSRSHLKILRAWRVTRSKSRTDELQTSGATGQNVVTRATGRPEFVHPWMMMRMLITKWNLTN